MLPIIIIVRLPEWCSSHYDQYKVVPPKEREMNMEKKGKRVRDIDGGERERVGENGKKGGADSTPHTSAFSQTTHPPSWVRQYRWLSPQKPTLHTEASEFLTEMTASSSSIVCKSNRHTSPS